jgi:hypothetical protein
MDPNNLHCFYLIEVDCLIRVMWNMNIYKYVFYSIGSYFVGLYNFFSGNGVMLPI